MVYYLRGEEGPLGATIDLRSRDVGAVLPVEPWQTGKGPRLIVESSRNTRAMQVILEEATLRRTTTQASFSRSARLTSLGTNASPCWEAS